MRSLTTLGTPWTAAVLPRRVMHTFPDSHSVFFCNLLGLPWERALTWDPDVLGVVIEAINRQ